MTEKKDGAVQRFNLGKSAITGEQLKLLEVPFFAWPHALILLIFGEGVFLQPAFRGAQYDGGECIDKVGVVVSPVYKKDNGKLDFHRAPKHPGNVYYPRLLRLFGDLISAR